MKMYIFFNFNEDHQNVKVALIHRVAAVLVLENSNIIRYPCIDSKCTNQPHKVISARFWVCTKDTGCRTVMFLYYRTFQEIARGTYVSFCPIWSHEERCCLFGHFIYILSIYSSQSWAWMCPVGCGWLHIAWCSRFIDTETEHYSLWLMLHIQEKSIRLSNS